MDLTCRNAWGIYNQPPLQNTRAKGATATTGETANASRARQQCASNASASNPARIIMGYEGGKQL